MKTSIVDSFIDLRFKGNQVGVCILELALFDGRRLCIAEELKVSKTTFF